MLDRLLATEEEPELESMQKFGRMHVFVVGILALFLSLSIATMGDTAIATAEPVQSLDVPPPDGNFIDLEEVDADILAWMANETQMSIDPSDALQGIKPDFTCMDPPHDCPAKTQCQWLAFGGALCTVTSCGLGSCPICPSIFPNVIVKSWCAYGCMKGKTMVGGAFMIQTRFRWIGPFCIPT